jgi:hypothetical protein
MEKRVGGLQLESAGIGLVATSRYGSLQLKVSKSSMTEQTNNTIQTNKQTIANIRMYRKVVILL